MKREMQLSAGAAEERKKIKRQNKPAARLRRNRLPVGLRLREKLDRLRPFVFSCGITLAVFGLLAGWGIAGYRCRMTADPPAYESIVFDWREDYLRLQIFDWAFSVRVEVIPLRTEPH